MNLDLCNITITLPPHILNSIFLNPCSCFSGFEIPDATSSGVVLLFRLRMLAATTQDTMVKTQWHWITAISWRRSIHVRCIQILNAIVLFSSSYVLRLSEFL
jgi:hypothetical protein